MLVVHVERHVLREAPTRVEPDPRPRQIEDDGADRRHGEERERHRSAPRTQISSEAPDASRDEEMHDERRRKKPGIVLRIQL